MNTIHDWDLNPSPLQAFRQSNKSVELRLFDEKRRQLKLGDLIRFFRACFGFGV
jgi:ASC-1-like (ASCH) protein